MAANLPGEDLKMSHFKPRERLDEKRCTCILSPNCDKLFHGLTWTVKGWDACRQKHPIFITHNSEYTCGDFSVLPEEPVPVTALNKK